MPHDLDLVGDRIALAYLGGGDHGGGGGLDVADHGVHVGDGLDEDLYLFGQYLDANDEWQKFIPGWEKVS